MSKAPENFAEFPPEQQRALELISAVCDERITPDQLAELESMVCQNRDIRKLYVDVMHMHAGLYIFASAMSEMDDPSIQRPARSGEAPLSDADLQDPDSALGLNETMVMPAMLGDDLQAQDDDNAEELFQPSPSVPANPPTSPVRQIYAVKGSIAALITLTLGLLAYFLPQWSNPQAGDFTRPISKPTWYLATVELSTKPVWDYPDGLAHDDQFAAGESLVLKSGVVKLALRHNTSLIVEGPADIRFVSDIELSVNAGRLVANCPGGGLIVRCPTGTVIDLGTQFGVAVTPGGGTDVEVFKGRVSAAMSNSASTATTQPISPMILSVGQAAILSGQSMTRSPEGAIPQRYICSLENQSVNSLSLVDLIGGGDGTGNRRGIAIDQTTGEIGNLTPVMLRSGDHLYHAVKGFPVVDGAFVPDGSKGSMVVDSAGHQFTFPATTNSTINQIWTGGPIPWADELGISTTINGEDYSLAPHTNLCTHSNNGITIDLDAVRRLYPDRMLTRFNAKFSNTYVNGLKGASKVNPIASVYILLDGVARYKKLNFTNQDGVFGVDLPISNSERFLTLTAVDDGNDIDRDWILWGDPKIDVAPAN